MSMNRSDGLEKYVGPVQLQASSTSYFSQPEQELDPELFVNTSLRGWVRNGLLQKLYGFLNAVYRHPDIWTTVWLAGSAVSYQWSAEREPGDLDVLIGVNYIQFRKAHPEYMGLSDVEISKMLNEDFRENLQPEMTNWNGFEVTFYVNPGATDIRTINPYAAYDLTHNEWTVFPEKTSAPTNATWESSAQKDRSMASDIVMRYSQALTDLQGANNDAARRNAEFRLQTALMQGSALFEDIHHSRRYAFSQQGKGYSDFYNYRWQAGKKYGTVPALRKMSDYWTAYKSQQAEETYGIELPDTQTLIRRAATYRAKG
jgi:hypothetical protein